VSVVNQAYIFLCSIGAGFVVGFAFDVFRVIKSMLRISRLIIWLNDILFWAVTSTIIFVLIFLTNDGELRWYTFLGVILGAIFYYLLFSRLIMNISFAAIKTIKKMLLLIIRIILFPIVYLVGIIKKPFLVFIKMIKRVFNTITKIKRFVRMHIRGFKRNLKILLKKT
jgi:spore cortex biosynthesis protein YabQ